MKPHLLLFGLITFLVVGCNTNKNAKEEINLNNKDSISLENPVIEKGKQTEINYLILNNSVGEFKIGNRIPNSTTLPNYKIKKATEPRMTDEGSSEEEVYIVTEDEKIILNLFPGYSESGEYTQNIGEILLFSEKYKTKEGIGVNSTIQEFIEKYPDYNMWYTYISDMYVIETKELNIQFILDGKGLIGPLDASQDLIPIAKEDFKKGTKIIRIRMYEI